MNFEDNGAKLCFARSGLRRFVLPSRPVRWERVSRENVEYRGNIPLTTVKRIHTLFTNETNVS